MLQILKEGKVVVFFGFKVGSGFLQGKDGVGWLLHTLLKLYIMASNHTRIQDHPMSIKIINVFSISQMLSDAPWILKLLITKINFYWLGSSPLINLSHH